MSEAAAAAIFDTGTEEEAAADTATPAAAATEKPAEGAPLPWWERAVPGKWGNEDEAIKGYAESSKEARRLAEAEKAASAKATELETKWNGIAPIIGAPVDEKGKEAPYDWGFPPEATVDPVMIKLAETTLREMNLSSGAAQKLAGTLAGYEAAREMGWRERETDIGVKGLGVETVEQAKALAAADFAWWTGSPLLAGIPNLPDVLADCGNSGNVVTLLHHLRAQLTGVNSGRGTGAGSPFGKAEYDGLIQAQTKRQLTDTERSQMVEFLNSQHRTDG